MVTQFDYDQLIVEAARAVLLEVINVLGEYRDGIALVGGWVPTETEHILSRHMSIDMHAQPDSFRAEITIRISVRQN